VDRWAERLTSSTGAKVRRVEQNEAGQPVPRLEISFANVEQAIEIVARLWDDDPRIAVLRVSGNIYLSPDTLEDGESELVIERLVVAMSTRD
jgi:hypothetical protein